MKKQEINILSKKDLQWRDGAPISPQFDDVYFCIEDGIAESQCVFIDTIGLDETLRQQSCTTDVMTIAETGFGTGLNFLLTWQRFQTLKPKGRLFFISTESHPLDIDALEISHGLFPSLSVLSQQLRDTWPVPSTGFHLRHFDNHRVSLLLLYGDAQQSLAKLKASVDAWYLDGFTPSKNPEMWTPALFSTIAKLSKPSAKLATFTATGFVNRGLQDAGFDMQKAQGFGKKRERLTGTYAAISNPKHEHKKPKRIAIIGNGFSGAFMAKSLTSKGFNIQVFFSTERHKASNVPVTILAPRLQLDHSPTSEFFNTSYSHAVMQSALTKNKMSDNTLCQKAVEIKDFSRQGKLMKHLNWPKDWLYHLDNALHFPKSTSYDSAGILDDLLKDIVQIEATITDIIRGADNLWTLKNNNQQLGSFDHVILCTGVETINIKDSDNLNIVPVRGQSVTYTDTDKTIPAGNYAYSGYICDAKTGSSDRVIGSTFIRQPNLDGADIISQNETDFIMDTAMQVMDMSLNPENIKDIYVGLRATIKDHLPLVGELPDWGQWKTALEPLRKDSNIPPLEPLEYQTGLYMMTGMGSKALQYAPLCAEIISAMVTGQPLPIPTKVKEILCPGRFLKRKIIKSL